MPSPDRGCEVVVVGAAFSGFPPARQLARSGVDVLVTARLVSPDADPADPRPPIGR